MGSGRSMTMASSVASKSLKSGTFAPAMTAESGPPSASTRIERLTPTLALYRWDLGLRDPPKTGLAHSPVRSLPLEVHPAKLLALLDESLPDQIQNSLLDPSLEGAMHR